MTRHEKPNDDDLAKAIVVLAQAISRLGTAIESRTGEDNINKILERIALAERNIMLTSTELATGLNAIATQQGKIAAEQAAKSDALLARIAELQAKIDAGEVSPEIETAFNAVKAASQALDDVIPDAP